MSSLELERRSLLCVEEAVRTTQTTLPPPTFQGSEGPPLPLTLGGRIGYDEVPGMGGAQHDSKDQDDTLSKQNGHDKEEQGKRSISALRLAMITYFFTSGGPTGCEAAIGAAGPLYTLLAFLIVPIVWCLPQALMSAELSLMMDQNGGNILWVRKAFGNFVGWMNAFNFLTYMMASMAITVVLFTDYLPDDVIEELAGWQKMLMQLGFCLLLMGLNMWGIEWVSRLSGLFFLIIYMPFIVEAIAAPIIMKDELDWMAVWEPMNIQDTDPALFLSTVLWCFGSFDSIGSVAGEVEGGRNTFLKGIAYSLPVVMVNYLLPLFVGYAIAPQSEDWMAGYFTEVAYRVSGWLGIWMVIASEFANFAQYNAGMVSVSRVLWACGKGTGEEQMLPSFISWSMTSATGVIKPIMSNVITAALTYALSLLPFDVLVQFTMAVRIINLFCEYGALIMLKWKEPHTHRPFSIPGGMMGAIVISLPTIVLSIVLLVFAEWTLWAFTGGLNAAFLIAYGIRWLWIRFFCI